MSSAKKTISLKRVKCGKIFPFDFEHALALLRLQASKGNGGWVISDKNWNFENNEICRRSNTRDIQETKEQ